MITAADLQRLVDAMGVVAAEDIAWAESLEAPAGPEEFAAEAIFVICNSGMKHTVARGVYNRVISALQGGESARTAFNHIGKAAAIDKIWADRLALWRGYLDATDKLAFCAELPWIGEITKYHLAKNFGAQVAKPDVHLQRLADREGVTAQALCERLATETGWKVSTVDTLLWRACATGHINSRTGEPKWVSG